MFNREKAELELRKVLEGKNLIVADSNYDQLHWLRINMDSDGNSNPTLGEVHGNAYQEKDNEIFIHIAIKCGGYDFSTEDGYSEEEVEEMELDEDLAESESFVEDNISDWVNMCEKLWEKAWGGA